MPFTQERFPLAADAGFSELSFIVKYAGQLSAATVLKTSPT